MKIKILFLSIISCFIGVLFFTYKVMSDEKEKELVRIPLENYLKGHATGDPEFMRKAFYTDGNMTFVTDNKYAVKTFDEFIAGFKGKPAADENKRKRYIESIDVTGNAAIGKIILD